VGPRIVEVNRAPVLTLWAAVAAERMGHDRKAALSMGKAVAGLVAQAKGRTLGIYTRKSEGGAAKKTGLGEDAWITVCGQPVPVKRTPDGLRAVVRDVPVSPARVEDYLEKAFGESLGAVREAMESLASAYSPQDIEQASHGLYERFRPAVPRGTGGWGKKGKLDLDAILRLRPV
jgi:hypothetical protein